MALSARRVDGAVLVALHAELVPDHWPREQRCDVQDDHAVLEDTHAPRRLADHDSDRPGFLGYGGGGPVPRAEAARKRDALGGCVDVHARGLRHAVAPDHQRPLQLSDVLDLLANLAVADVPLLAAI